jgi:hypothetical protein
VLIVYGRGGARKVIDLVDFHVKGECDVVPHYLEVRVIHKVGNIPLSPRKEVVHTKDVMAFVQEAFTQMGP